MSKIKNFFGNIKAGLSDVKNMALERNYKPLIRPIIAIVLAYMGVNFLNGFALEKLGDTRQKMEAQKVEADTDAEYRRSKQTFVTLKQKLPPFDRKDEFILAQTVNIFQSAGLNSTRTGKNTTETSGIFTISSVDVEAELTYEELGKLVQAIENGEFYMRISNLNVNRQSSTTAASDKLKVSMKLNTLFVDDSGQGGNANAAGAARRGFRG